MSSALPPEALTSNPVEHRPDKAVGVGLGAVILQRQKKQSRQPKLSGIVSSVMGAQQGWHRTQVVKRAQQIFHMTVSAAIEMD
ncbi:hypothetical protein [Ralstonia sp. GP71]|uniref:hypothetical protein n=1 Tax=Ralstonia sp. GP71 TaxID=3035152 RepID=UPI0038926CFA